MENFSWKCPHCNRDVTITKHDVSQMLHVNDIENSVGRHSLQSTFIVCPNPDCKKYVLECTLWKTIYDKRIYEEYCVKKIREWNLVPPSNAKPFPDYIPAAIRADYEEACLIKDLSPKAAATLARRCLQGIIRDFWEVKCGSLNKEIEAIKDKVDLLTWEAIDAVRKVGNIGAHMEKDINLIVDIEPNEVELLISLIETLFKDWYMAREEQRARLEEISNIAQNKDEKRKENSKEND